MVLFGSSPCMSVSGSPQPWMCASTRAGLETCRAASPRQVFLSRTENTQGRLWSNNEARLALSSAEAELGRQWNQQGYDTEPFCVVIKAHPQTTVPDADRAVRFFDPERASRSSSGRTRLLDAPSVELNWFGQAPGLHGLRLDSALKGVSRLPSSAVSHSERSIYGGNVGTTNGFLDFLGCGWRCIVWS